MKAITHAELVARGLAFVAASKGDPRSSLNATYSQALAAEIGQLREELERWRSWPQSLGSPITPGADAGRSDS